MALLLPLAWALLLTGWCVADERGHRVRLRVARNAPPVVRGRRPDPDDPPHTGARRAVAHRDPGGHRRAETARPFATALVGPAAWRVVRSVVVTPIAEVRRARRTAEAVAAAVPDVVDLFAVAVAAGCTVRLATFAVAERAPPGPVRDALVTVTKEVAAGDRLADALERLPDRLGEPIRPLAAALTDAERYGTSLGATLDRLAADARRTRQRRAEEVARRLPVKLLFPLVTCILPAFGLLTVAPLIVGGLQALRP